MGSDKEFTALKKYQHLCKFNEKKNHMLACKMDVLSYEDCVKWFYSKYGEFGLVAERRTFIHNYAWAIPNTEAIDTICEYSPITEIGCGGGYWAWRVLQSVGDIQPYDYKTLRKIENLEGELKERMDRLVESASWEHMHRRFYIYPIPKCTEFTTATPDRTLMLCWPPYDSPMAHNCLRYYEGDTFIFVGELDGGCGDYDFMKLIYQQWEYIKCVDIPQFLGMRDCLYVFKRKHANEVDRSPAR